MNIFKDVKSADLCFVGQTCAIKPERCKSGLIYLHLKTATSSAEALNLHLKHKPAPRCVRWRAFSWMYVRAWTCLCPYKSCSSNSTGYFYLLWCFCLTRLQVNCFTPPYTTTWNIHTAGESEMVGSSWDAGTNQIWAGPRPESVRRVRCLCTVWVTCWTCRVCFDGGLFLSSDSSGNLAGVQGPLKESKVKQDLPVRPATCRVISCLSPYKTSSVNLSMNFPLIQPQIKQIWL